MDETHGNQQTRLSPLEYAALKTMLYHVVPPDMANIMAALRTQYLHLGLAILRSQDPTRSKSIALTHLEESLMRAIQGLALQGHPVIPLGFTIEGDLDAG